MNGDGGGLTIVGLGGSLAATSRSRAALRVALEGTEREGARTRLLDLRELDMPMYDLVAGRPRFRFARARTRGIDPARGYPPPSML